MEDRLNTQIVPAETANNDDVFAAYGYDNIPTTTVVVQRTGEDLIVNNNVESNMLTPPPVLDDAEEVSAESELTSVTLNETVVQELMDDTSEISTNELPQIDELYSKKDRTSRFSGSDWYNDMKYLSVLIVGAGGIGSMAAFAISRLDVSHIMLYDDDNIEAVNYSGQFFSSDQLGRNKAIATKNNILRFSQMYYCSTYNRKFTAHDPVNANVMVCGLDNMEARRGCFEAWLNYIRELDDDERKNRLFIDGRLALDQFQVFCITGDDTHAIEKYDEEYLFSSEEAEEVVCSRKQTTYCAMMIGAVIANMIVNFVCNKDMETASLPFKTYYNARMAYFKTETSWM